MKETLEFVRSLTLIIGWIALGTGVVLAQSNKPAVDQASELAGLRTCFVISDRLDGRARLIKEMEKQHPEWDVIESAADAQFFLESRVVDVDSDNDPTAPVATTELVAFIKRDGQRVVVWQEQERDDDTPRSNEANLIRHLVKALNAPRSRRP